MQHIEWLDNKRKVLKKLLRRKNFQNLLMEKQFWNLLKRWSIERRKTELVKTKIEGRPSEGFNKENRKQDAGKRIRSEEKGQVSLAEETKYKIL